MAGLNEVTKIVEYGSQIRFLYVLWNTATEEVEAQEYMTSGDAWRRNRILRINGEPQRWVARGSEDL